MAASRITGIAASTIGRVLNELGAPPNRGHATGGNIFAKITWFTLDPIGNTIVRAGGGALGGQILQGLGA